MTKNQKKKLSFSRSYFLNNYSNTIIYTHNKNNYYLFLLK
ncbi:hypothetical protein AB895_0242 [Acinetobacter baumannii]|uniref:Uncharacterized protein n=1 Tax=Acinetobacter baumannii 625974 TaxID=1310607 RepID=A0A009Q686_ACIBA|nr:hypothetical protein J506_3402 [Acinetobacter baumannii 625974]KMV08339.1 hypothetical protein AB895_0242 [Acinetobacter baumannii]